MPPWDRYQQPQQGQPAPTPAPTQIGGTRVLGGVPASEQRAQQDQNIQLQQLEVTRQQAATNAAQEAERLRLAQEAAARAGVPTGYERDPATGGIRPIPGGPQDPNAPQVGAQGNAVPQGAADRADKEITQYTALLNSLGTFDDNFGGNWFGGLENAAQARLPDGAVGTPGQSEWWANFRRNDNQIRNELFGATLTPSEQAAYAATSIDPGMNAAKIRANLQSRADIVQGALTRRYEFYLANGFRREAVDALFAPLLDRMGMAGQAAGEQSLTPPALGRQANDPITTDATGAPTVRVTAPRRDDTPPPIGGTGGTGGGPDSGPQGDGRVLGNTHDAGNDTMSTGIARGERRRVDNPVLAGLRGNYSERLGSGQTADQLIAYLREAGANVDPEMEASVRAQAAFRAENPEVPISEYDTTELDDQFVDVSLLQRAMGAASGTSAGAYFANAADALTGFNSDSIVGMMGGNAEQARAGLDQIRSESPIASTVGTLSGGALAAIGGEVALGRAGIAAGLPRALAADAGYGAVAGAGATDYAADGTPANMTDRLRGAGMGALAGAVGSYAGQRAGNALTNMARGVKDASVNALRREGVDALTVGQTYGNSGRIGAAVKGVEDRLAGLPIIGDAIRTRQTEALAQLNTRAFDRALEPIGGNVGGKVGQEAVEEAQQQVSQAFTDALAGRGAVPDEAFSTSMTNAVNTARSRLDRSHPGLIQDIADIFLPYADETVLSGEALQVISRELRDTKFAYRQDPRFKVIGNSIDRIERAVFDLFDRQASGTVPAYNKARAAYRRLATLEDAVMKAQNQTDQMFTPAQLNRADTASGKRLEGRRAAARGDTPFNDLAVAGQAVLPNRVPDSGTAGRLLIPLALVGAGGGTDVATGSSGQGLTMALILSGLFTKTGQRALTKPGRGMAAGTRRRAFLENPKTGRAIGAVGASGGAALTNQN